MDFQQRLAKAIERGQLRGDERSRAKAEKEISEKELARLHSQYRLELSEHIEKCLKQLADNFPGFRFETVVGERGWGASIRRDDLNLKGGRRDSLFSRLQMVVRPASSYNILDMAAKGTVRNKELFNRNHYQRLTEVDPTSFNDMVDLWVLEYAEVFAAGS
jgi:hypothetical protein